MPSLTANLDYDQSQLVTTEDKKGVILLEQDRFHELSCGNTDDKGQLMPYGGCKWTVKKETKSQLKGAVTVLLDDDFTKSLDFFE